MFSITPRQIQQTDEFLRVASDSNQSLLCRIRQSDEDVKLSLDGVKQESERLAERILTAQFEAEANKIATKKSLHSQWVRN